jgi:methionyl-tRNA formyltransferase
VLNGEKFKIWRTRRSEAAAQGLPGEIIGMTKQGILVSTGDGILEILELQAPGKKRMLAPAYVNGHGLGLHALFDPRKMA